MATITTVTLPDNSVNDLRASSIPYGAVDGSSTSTVFKATVPGITALTDGTIVMLRNNVVTSASGFTLNVNNLGAKPVYSNMDTDSSPGRETTIFNIAYTMIFVYSSTLVSGGAWVCYRGYDSNTNTIGYQIRTNSYSLPMKSITYRYRILFQSADRTGWVPATNSTSTNATTARTVCQDPIDPFGLIVYYGTTASVAAGSRPSASNLWEQYYFGLGYSFNRTGAALVLTLWKPVYVKCAPQADGSAIIDADTPYVQSLPTTADGKIYIFLGVAYSETNIEMNLHHPVYYHDGTNVVLWTFPKIPSKTSDLTNDSNFVADSSYVHTDNNFTTALKDKLDGIEAGAEANVQADWTESDNTSDAYIQHKPTIPSATSQLTNDSDFVSDSAYVHTDNNFTTTLKDKLDGISAGAEVNVQANWNESDNTSDAYIQNKPTIPTATSDLTNDSDFVADASYVHTDNNYTTSDKDKLSGIASGAEVNVQSDWNEADSTSDAYINNKPTIPTNTSDLVNDSGYITGLYMVSYGHSTWADFLDAFSSNKIVYCRASSNSNPATGSQNRLAFMAYVNNQDPDSITEVEFQYYRSVNQHSNNQQGDQTYVYKLNKSTGWSVTVRENYTKIVAGTGLTGTWSNGVLTISLA